jgi:DNA-binding NtrC family response regulator
MSFDSEVRALPQPVLLIADDEDSCGPLARAIAQLGYELERASSAAEAVAMAQARAFAVVVSDLQQTRRERTRLIEQLCAERPATAFVLVADDPRAELRWDEQIDVAIASVIGKPPHADELANALEHAFAFHGRRSSARSSIRELRPSGRTKRAGAKQSADG